MRPTPLFIACLLAVFAAGYALGHRRPAPATAAGRPAEILRPGAAPAGSLAASVPQLTVDQIIAQLADECRRGIWRRTAQWDVLLARLSPSDFGRILAAVREFVLSPTQDELRRTLLARRAEGDPRAAIDFVHGLPNSSLRDQLMLSALQGWLHADLAGAVAWIKELPPGAVRADALRVAPPRSPSSTSAPPTAASPSAPSPAPGP